MQSISSTSTTPARPRSSFGSPRLLVAAAALLGCLLVAAAVMAVVLRMRTLTGGQSLGGAVAPDFQLPDSTGQLFSLQQYRGKPVVLAFLYTHCPDACPLISDKLRETLQKLGPDASRVQMLAVSVDPKGDTPAAVRAFSKEHGMQGRWHYLVGTPRQLQPVWKDYYIGVMESPTAGTVGHSDAVFLVDKSGRERRLFDDAFRVRDLYGDLRKLL
ncbi:MAG: SCO family protein [Chloroflexota bacterium]